MNSNFTDREINVGMVMNREQSTIGLNDSVADALALLDNKEQKFLVVTMQNGRPKCLLLRDSLKDMYFAGQLLHDNVEHFKISEVLFLTNSVQNPPILSPDVTLQEAAELSLRTGLPLIVAENDSLAGVFSSDDLLNFLSKEWSERGQLSSSANGMEATAMRKAGVLASVRVFENEGGRVA